MPYLKRLNWIAHFIFFNFENSSNTLIDSFTRAILAKNISWIFFRFNSLAKILLPISERLRRYLRNLNEEGVFFRIRLILCRQFFKSSVNGLLLSENLAISSQTRSPSFARLIFASNILFTPLEIPRDARPNEKFLTGFILFLGVFNNLIYQISG